QDPNMRLHEAILPKAPMAAPPQLRRCLALNDPARRLGEELRHVSGERAPYLDAELESLGPPEHDLGLCQQGARTHPDREGARIEIERAARGQQRRRLGATHPKGGLPMTHV